MATTGTDQLGRVLGDRYRLIAPLGTGASSQVFLADDATLRRRVAVKMLHPTLADDDVFLKRFRSEAQAAGALNHPNIMAVYDWGQDGVPYLVCEYLGGGTLRAVLDAGHRLSPSQALMVGLDAVRGLDYAHRRGLVHRDIKPGNLIFDDEHRLRIADFGLARALAEAGWTEPHGTVVGTARYASPEQAQGQSLTGKSDVYALALVLVEAVTGTVPFSADTTLGTLMARVDQPLPVPDDLGPLRTSLERAGSPDPDERPDAGEFGVALMAAAEELPRPKPIPTVDTLATNGAAVADRDPTMMAPGLGSESAADEPVLVTDSESRAADPLEPEGPVSVVGGRVDDDSPPPRKAMWALVFAGLLALVGVGGWFAYQATVTP
ncbi:MAG: protein kinase, partial [Acidimicrobiia bacterium]|nr:protein kinase [Acidimicrobiia bacterium]